MYRHYHRWIRRYATTLTTGRYLLEVGSGPGFFLRLASNWYPSCEVIGLDKDWQALRASIQATSGVHYIQADAIDLPLRHESIDVVIGLHVIEHIIEPERFIREVQRVLKPDGLFLLATPNPAGIGARVTKSRWIGWRDEHKSVYSPRKWIDLIEKAGFLKVRLGSTGLSGIPLFRKFPLMIPNYLVLGLFGVLPWCYGEALIGLFRRRKVPS